jgi:FKBP-type peptidyl-prolyl cis-trans isomerase 2
MIRVRNFNPGLLMILAGVVLCLCGGHFAKAYATENKSPGKQTSASGEKAAGSVTAPVKEDQAKVEKGDLVELYYTISLQDGSLLSTNVSSVAADPTRAKSEWYEEPKAFSTEKVVAGQKTELAGLGEAVIGMAVKEKRNIVLPPEKAYGEPDPKKIQQSPCVKTMPKIARLSPQEYVKNYNSFPIVGQELWINPYFPARIAEVTEKEAVLEYQQKEGQVAQSDLGAVSVAVDENNVVITLTPKIGIHVAGNGQEGRITSSDGVQFTVDYNHPAAGKSVVVDMEIVSLTRASALNGLELSWLDDHDKGLKEAAQENKPMVLLLYADWCPWCKRLMNESFVDPRVKVLKDRFVWVKVNSEKEGKYKQMYGQEGYPMIVFLDAKGQVLKKDSSFLDGSALGRELDSVLKQAG